VLFLEDGTPTLIPRHLAQLTRCQTWSSRSSRRPSSGAALPDPRCSGCRSSRRATRCSRARSATRWRSSSDPTTSSRLARWRASSRSNRCRAARWRSGC